MLYAQIALPLPLEESYDYAIPEAIISQIKIGCRVKVSFGRQMLTGFCIGISEQTRISADKIKQILEILDFEPVISEKMLVFARWWARYYHCSLGEALEATVPNSVATVARKKNILIMLQDKSNIEAIMEDLKTKSPIQAKILQCLKDDQQPVDRNNLRKKLQVTLAPFKSLESKGLITTLEEERESDVFENLPIPSVSPIQLTSAQASAVCQIESAIQAEKFQAFLLFGVTGSGKTEVYLKTIEIVTKLGKEAIVLVPEIALTPQTVIRFKQRFPNVAVLHSELTQSQRSYQWQQIQQGKIQVVIGPRSAIFAPTHRLGLIVVDEEHEPSFKQQNTPRYHARDLAVKRGQDAKAVVILGSATPSLETYQNCLTNKYSLIRLPERIGTAHLPEFIVVNMKEECQQQKKFVYFSRMLLSAIEENLKNKQQTILFLNRRGFATTISCPVCGYHIHCPHCEILLTYHKQHDTVQCHYCNYEQPAPNECPHCHFLGIRFLGIGTEKVESLLKEKFPQAIIHRMDSDTMISRRSYEESFLSFASGQVDILLGTQMIAKGLDFPKVTLVGIISADTSLQLPDFRSAERSFQLIVQVAGRAGRGSQAGRVILQTWQTDHYAIQFALQQDYEKFAQEEMQFRESLQYPPFGKLLRIVVEGKEEKEVTSHITQIVQQFPSEGCEILGPAPAPLSKIKDSYRWHIIIKADSTQKIAYYAAILKKYIPGTSRVHVFLDVDPTSLL